MAAQRKPPCIPKTSELVASDTFFFFPNSHLRFGRSELHETKHRAAYSRWYAPCFNFQWEI
jgi:hypothetical protein